MGKKQVERIDLLLSTCSIFLSIDCHGKIYMYLKQQSDGMYNRGFQNSQFECIPLVLFLIETYITMLILLSVVILAS